MWYGGGMSTPTPRLDSVDDGVPSDRGVASSHYRIVPLWFRIFIVACVAAGLAGSGAIIAWAITGTP